MSSIKLYQQMENTLSPSLRHLATPPEPKAPPQPPLCTLKRTGARPFRFHGRQVAGGTGWNTTAHSWYEINLYVTEGDSVVTELRLFCKNVNGTDLFRVNEHEDWDMAIAWLERYNPANDLTVDLNIDDSTLSIAEVSLRGLQLRRAMAELKMQFQSTLGELLYALKKDLID
jgi:hypothetical protein